ncbi:hypothetical protein L5515_002501 [Caenorhabditis briggsae]|uniref:MATH domain-containing protein n=1 Tax=Caenorhabditis briggsae TaxID=6238 RepID=A0AAE9E5L6_CAEBR|nr:hypothetical protein L5515_002501 [Caenorhabditis briggsae]
MDSKSRRKIEKSRNSNGVNRKKIIVKRLDNHLDIYLALAKERNNEEWSVDTFHSFEMSVTQKYNEIIKQRGEICNGHMYGALKFCTWQYMQNYILVDGKLSVKAQVHIKKMAGSAKSKLIDFDASAKFSDYILEVGGQKFHVLKQEKLLSEIKTLETYKSIVADGVDDFSLDVAQALLKKSLTLQ